MYEVGPVIVPGGWPTVEGQVVRRDRLPGDENASQTQILPGQAETADTTVHPQTPRETPDQNELPAAAASSLSKEASGLTDGEGGGGGSDQKGEHAKNPGPGSQTERTVLRRISPSVSARFELPDSYQEWNRAIIEYCLLAEHPGESRLAYLSIGLSI